MTIPTRADRSVEHLLTQEVLFICVHNAGRSCQPPSSGEPADGQTLETMGSIRQQIEAHVTVLLDELIAQPD
jgi:hypothetical protein